MVGKCKSDPNIGRDPRNLTNPRQGFKFGLGIILYMKSLLFIYALSSGAVADQDRFRQAVIQYRIVSDEGERVKRKVRECKFFPRPRWDY